MNCWRRIRRTRPSLKLMVMGMETTPDHIQPVIGAGAKGYSAQRRREGEIRMAHGDRAGRIDLGSAQGAGEAAGGGSVALEAAAAPAAGVIEEMITEREREVLRLLMTGGRTGRLRRRWGSRGDGEGAPGADAAQDGGEEPDRADAAGDGAEARTTSKSRVSGVLEQGKSGRYFLAKSRYLPYSCETYRTQE